jgi:hypothetical protein
VSAEKGSIVKTAARRSETMDPRSRLLPGIVLLAGLMALPSGAAARAPLLESAWRDSSAADREPRGAGTAIGKGRVSVAASNDDRFLVLTLTTHDRRLYSLMFRNGMTLWLDPSGGRRRTLGVRYPLGIESPPGRDISRMGPDRRGRDGGPGPGREPEPDALLPPAQVLEILGSGGEEPRRVLASDIPGFALEILDSDDTFTYRLKMPLTGADDRSVGVGARAGETIGVGWETGREKAEGLSPEGPGSRDGMGGGRGGGSRGGMGGGMGGDMSGDMGGGRGGRGRGGMGRGSPDDRSGGGTGREEPRKIADPLKVWVKVRLAAPGMHETR